jgi:anti-sigma factor RsiW
MKTWMMKLMGLPSCEEIGRFAYDYLEGQLEPGVRDKFARHLRGCRNCAHFVESYRQVARPERLAQKIPLDPEFERRVARFLRENE